MFPLPLIQSVQHVWENMRAARKAKQERRLRRYVRELVNCRLLAGKLHKQLSDTTLTSEKRLAVCKALSSNHDRQRLLEKHLVIHAARRGVYTYKDHVVLVAGGKHSDRQVIVRPIDEKL